jgi:lysine 2,3-aminomutase
VHSYEYYDRENGIAVYAAPSVKPGKAFLYFDPIDKLTPDAQARWAVRDIQEQMIHEALRKAGSADEALVLA